MSKAGRGCCRCVWLIYTCYPMYSRHKLTKRQWQSYSWLAVRCWRRLPLWHGRWHCRHIGWSVCRHLLTRVHLMVGWWIASRLVHSCCCCCCMLLITARHHRLLHSTKCRPNRWGITTLNLGISSSFLLCVMVIWWLNCYKVPNITQQLLAAEHYLIYYMSELYPYNINVYTAVQLFMRWVPSQSYGASPAIWDHTVLSATWHKWKHPP